MVNENEMIEWAKKHFAEMSIGGIWMPEGSGLTYQKLEETRTGKGSAKWRLVRRIDNEQTLSNHEKMKVLMFDAGFICEDKDAEVIPEPRSMEEAQIQELQMKREIAQTWADTDGTLLIDMGLENVWPEYVEDREVMLDDGETTSVEIWAYRPTNPNTGEVVSIDPDDYHMLMGDQYFMRFCISHDDEGVQFRALSRQEMVEYIDAGNEGIGIGSKIKINFKHGVVEDKVPPWMWGTYCEETDIKEEEE
tara:strand:- start:570 stop:1316 length:747 start_codon:yes stop_codon:yes gene_type:complete